MKPSKLITYFIAVALTVLTGVAMAAATDWVGPTAEPPANNTPTPLNVGSAAQTKTGSLTVGSDLIINGKICLGGVCLNAWPDTTTVVAPPSGDVINGVCGAANGQTVVAAPTTDLCSTGIASTVSNTGTAWSWICNGSGGGVSSPCNATIATGWVTVAAVNKSGPGPGWDTEQKARWTANGPIAGVRVSGSSNDGGYCYASWGTGNVATWRHDPSIGVYNVDNRYYDGLPIYGYDFVLDTRPLTVEEYPTCQSGAFWGFLPTIPSESPSCLTCPAGQTLTAYSDENSTSYMCLKGYNTCPTNPALFTNDGTAKICQVPYSAGGLTTKSLVNMMPVPLAGNVFTLKGNFVDEPGTGYIDCKMEVLYK